MHQSSAAELQRLRPSAPAWLWLSVLASALRFQRWGTYDLPHAFSPSPPPSHQAARLRITSPPIADRARVPQPPPPQQYGYNAPPPQGQYGRPSEQLSSVRAYRIPPSGTLAPLLTHSARHADAPPSNSYGHAPRPPPATPQHFGTGAPTNYAFQYSQCNGRRKALLVGINYFGQRGQLRGCINDVRNMSAYLVEHFGYKREDMVLLTDDQQNPMSQPTKQNILRAMHWLVKDARPNDSLFFHYSGAPAVPDPVWARLLTEAQDTVDRRRTWTVTRRTDTTR